MLFEKDMNKRGQEGLSITTLLIIILGIVVVVVIILGVTKGFGFIFGKIDFLPGQDLQAVAESCATAAQLKLKIDYCVEFKKIKVDGAKEYVNCEDSRVESGIKSEVEKIECDKDTSQKYCEILIERKEYNAKVNGVNIGSNKDSKNTAKEHCGSIFK
ncbi:MAG: hypothetical protein AABW65_00800 [Nanoarchaeota archaeon]